MNLAYAGLLNDGTHVGGPQTATSQKVQSPRGELMQLAQLREALCGRDPSARGQKAAGTCSENIFERGLLVSDEIKGAMKGDGQGTSQIDKGACVGQIDAQLRGECAEHKAVASCLTCGHNIVAHDVEFVLGICKSTGAGANQYEDRDGDMAEDFAQESDAGRKAAIIECAAKFDPICTTVLRCNGGAHGVNTDFS